MPAPPSQSMVRPIASYTTRFIGATGVGLAASLGLAFWADTKPMPNESGESPGYIDRVEARKRFSGHESWTQYLGFTALMAVGILYSHTRKSLDEKEFKFLQQAAYAGAAGVLIGSMAAPALLPPLPETKAAP